MQHILKVSAYFCLSCGFISHFWKKSQPTTTTFLNSSELHNMVPPKKTLVSTLSLVPYLSFSQIPLDANIWNLRTKDALIQKQLDVRSELSKFWSRSHTGTETQYNTTYSKHFMVVQIDFRLRPCLESYRFTIHRDHDALAQTPHPLNFTGQPVQWRLWISPLYSEVAHCAGMGLKMVNAFSKSKPIEKKVSIKGWSSSPSDFTTSQQWMVHE